MRKLTLIILLIPNLVFANVTENIYAGVKLSKRSMGFEQGFGNNMFAKSLNQYSVFTGLRYNEFMGIELNFFTTDDGKRNVIINPEESALGVAGYSGLDNEEYRTSVDLQGAQFYLTGRYAVAKRLTFFGYAGLSIARLKTKADLISIDGATPDNASISDNRIDHSTTKTYPVVGIGVDYKIAKHLGVKADVSWENTNKFTSSFDRRPGGAPQTLTIRARNSLVCNVSIYF